MLCPPATAYHTSLTPLERAFSEIEQLLYPFHPEVLEARGRLVMREEEVMRRSVLEGRARQALRIGPLSILRGSLLLQAVHLRESEERKAGTFGKSKVLAISSSSLNSPDGTRGGGLSGSVDHTGLSLANSIPSQTGSIIIVAGTIPSPFKTQIPVPRHPENDETVHIETPTSNQNKTETLTQKIRRLKDEEMSTRVQLEEEEETGYGDAHIQVWGSVGAGLCVARTKLQMAEHKARRLLELELADEVNASVSAIHEERTAHSPIGGYRVGRSGEDAPLAPKPPTAPHPPTRTNRRFSSDTNPTDSDGDIETSQASMFPGRKAPYYTTTYLGHEDLPLHYQLAYIAQRESILRRNYALEEMQRWLDICEAAVESMAAIPIGLRSTQASPLDADAPVVPYQDGTGDAFSCEGSPASPECDSVTAEAITSPPSQLTASQARDVTVTAAAKRRILGHDETMDRMGITMDEERYRKGLLKLQPQNKD